MIDTHAHFFNASDVPVRGFIAESIGHNADPRLQWVLKEAAALAEKLAERAPTAAKELEELEKLAAGRRSATDLDNWFRDDRDRSAEAVSEIVSGTDFERRYREIVREPAGRSGGRGISPDEVKEAEDQASQPIDTRARLGFSDIARKAQAFLQFLRFMLSYRASNIRKYAEAFSPADGAGVDMVLGALVDFDYWLDCPPHSAHEDQIALHQHLAGLHGGYLRPVVGYNPWTDIEQDGAGLQRVRDAWASGVFVGAKIYPPTGFMPAGNTNQAAGSQKPRPNVKKLDDVLTAFFKECAGQGIPVIAHAARTNGRDAAHDDFSSPAAWDALLSRVATEAKTPVMSLGHFGGDNPATQWTSQFANLMKVYPKVQLFGDLGYWDHLMCDEPESCHGARERLKNVINIRVGEAETVADRVMFATDWLMMSQVPGWKAYPQRVRDGLESIAHAGDVAKILAGNAGRCFARIIS